MTQPITYPIPKDAKVIDIDYRQTVTMPSKGCLEDLKTKVCDIVQSKWTLVATVGLIVAAASGLVAGIVVGLVSAAAVWYFTPVEGDDLLMFTANVLGIFSDPFEFKGDYGPFINSVKAEVEDVLNGAWIRGGRDSSSLLHQDWNKGPLTKDLIPVAMREKIRTKFATFSGYNGENLNKIEQNLDRCCDGKLYNLLMNYPPQSLLKLDKEIREAMERGGVLFNLPILNSPAPIPGNNALEHKMALVESLFTPQNFKIAQDILEKVLKKLDIELEENEHIGGMRLKESFGTPEGIMYFYFLHSCMVSDLLTEKPGLIGRINQAKAEFMQTLGDPVKRAELFGDRFVKANADVVFAQECDKHVALAMEQRGFISTHSYIDEKGQKVTLSNDGSVLFLNPKKFSNKIKAIIDPKQDLVDVRAPVFITELLKKKVPCVLCPSHGHADKKDLLYQQIHFAKKVFNPIKERDPRARLGIGSDTNLKGYQDNRRFNTFLEQQSLNRTDVGPTENKTRVTGILRDKLYVESQYEKDVLITNQDAELLDQTVGGEKALDLNQPLPNAKLLADHAHVGALLTAPMGA